MIGLSLHAGNEVDVNAQSGREVGIAEHAGDYGDVRPVGDHDRGKGVPEVMEAHPRKSGCSRSLRR